MAVPELVGRALLRPQPRTLAGPPRSRLDGPRGEWPPSPSALKGCKQVWPRRRSRLSPGFEPGLQGALRGRTEIHLALLVPLADHTDGHRHVLVIEFHLVEGEIQNLGDPAPSSVQEGQQRPVPQGVLSG